MNGMINTFFKRKNKNNKIEYATVFATSKCFAMKISSHHPVNCLSYCKHFVFEWDHKTFIIPWS